MVVFVKYAMEEDGRRGKRVGKVPIWRRVFGGNAPSSVGSHHHSNLSLAPTSPPHERRPLRSVPTVGPQFKVDPEVLAKEYVEKETKYLGTLNDVPFDFDPGNRVMILSLLDEKKKLGFIPYRVSWKRDVVISFCVYNVKISWRDGEELIHRIPTHKIASTGFVQDDSQIYLFIKFASEVNDEMCNLAFFSCESQAIAQEICYLTQQLFQLAYTNSTMEFFDKSIRDGAVTPKHHSLSTDDSAEKKDTVKLQPYRASSPSDSVEVSSVVLNGNHSTPNPPQYKSSTLPFTSQHQQQNTTSPTASSTPSSPSVTLRSSSCKDDGNNSSATSASNNSNYQELQLNEYIQVLRERLTQEELRKFAEHLHHFRKGTLPIKIFCESLLAIYTEQRKSLLLGMRHFIPERKDRSYFENFLKRHDIETGCDDVRWWDRPPTSRTLSETEGSNASTTVNVNELSSNSDHVSPSHTSNEDSGEWKLVVEKMKSLKANDDIPSTIKGKSVEIPSGKLTEGIQQTMVVDVEFRLVDLFAKLPRPGNRKGCFGDEIKKELFSALVKQGMCSSATQPQNLSRLQQIVETPKETGAEDGTENAVETSNIPNVVLNSSDWDSPVLRSGQNKEIEGEPDSLFSHRRGDKQIKKKKSRGKSPSAAELGAPYPSLITGGTDDDLHSSVDKKAKKAMKHKRKDKIRNGNEEKDQSLNLTEDIKVKTKSMDDLTLQHSSDTDKSVNTKKKFFKAKAAKTKDKRVNKSDLMEAFVVTTPDPLPANTTESAPLPANTTESALTAKPPRKEHRKKRKHKSSDEKSNSNSTAF